MPSTCRCKVDATTPPIPAGLGAEVAQAINAELMQLYRLLIALINELTRLSREIGSDGWFGGQAEVPAAAGSWKHLVDSVNQMSAQLTMQVRVCNQALTALARGDTTQTVSVEAHGETQVLVEALNATAERLRRSAGNPTAP